MGAARTDHPVSIRECKRSDATQVSWLLNELNEKQLDESVVLDRLAYYEKAGNDYLYCVQLRGVVVGLLGFRIRENPEDDTRYAEISLLVIAKNYRRKGIATSAIGLAEGLAKEKHCIGLWLVSGFNREEKAHACYHKYGFRKTGYRFVKRFEP